MIWHEISKPKLCRNRVMKPSLISLLLGVLVVSTPQISLAVTMDWLLVGDPGNEADTEDGDINRGGLQRLGAVPYAFKIEKYDVTTSQYVEFLNAVDPSGSNALHLYIPPTNEFHGIKYSAGNTDGAKYVVLPQRGNRPVNHVTWYSAIRFANWMHNGQGNGSTETGAYTLGALDITTGRPTAGDSIVRNAGARIFLPSENEWYKAAFYNPGTSTYFDYGTSSNVIPIASAPTAAPNHINYDGGVSDLTDVGAYTGTTSPYGAFDMNGNAFQWNEDLITGGGTWRGMRGGSFVHFGDFGMRSRYRFEYTPYLYGADIGFRLASILSFQFPGDANGDGLVDFTDLGILLNKYNQPGTFTTGDFDNSGVVDFTDLGILLNNYNQSAAVIASANPVPEPSTLALAACGAIGLLIAARRKR